MDSNFLSQSILKWVTSWIWTRKLIEDLFKACHVEQKRTLHLDLPPNRKARRHDVRHLIWLISQWNSNHLLERLLNAMPKTYLCLTLNFMLISQPHNSRNLILKQLRWLPGNNYFNELLNIFPVRFDLAVKSLLPIYVVIGGQADTVPESY